VIDFEVFRGNLEAALSRSIGRGDVARPRWCTATRRGAVASTSAPLQGYSGVLPANSVNRLVYTMAQCPCAG
jgi:hypothetical protein